MERKNKKSRGVFLAALLPVCAALVLGACENPAGGDEQKEVVISEVFTTDSSTFIIKSDGTLWAAGSNAYGQLGLGDSDSRDKFTQVKDAAGKPLAGVKQVFGSDMSTIILKDDGSLWGAGSNAVGSLGLGDRFKAPDDNYQQDVSKHFIPITGDGTENGTPIAGVTALARGNGGVFFFLKNGGQIWAAGRNTSGQTGNGDDMNMNVYTFTHIATDSDGHTITGVNAIYVVGSPDNAAFFIKSGEAWATGFNELGNLGLGDKTNRNKFTKVPGLSNIEAMAGSDSFTVVLKSDGTLWGTGKNQSGALGLGMAHATGYGTDALETFTQLPSDGDENSGNYISGIKAIAAGRQHLLLLKEDGTVLASGLAYPYGVMLTVQAPRPIGALANIQFSSVTDMWGDTLVGVKDIKAIGLNSFFIMKNETVLGVGSSSDRLGLGKPLDASIVYLALDDDTNHIVFDEGTP